MRILFVKIFGWFWLGMLVANLALFFAFTRIRPTPSNRPWRDLSLVGSSAQKAAETYDRAGQEALAGYLEEFEKSNGIESILLNDQATELSGRPVPPGWQDLGWRDSAGRAMRTGITAFNVSSTSLL